MDRLSVIHHFLLFLFPHKEGGFCKPHQYLVICYKLERADESKNFIIIRKKYKKITNCPNGHHTESRNLPYDVKTIGEKVSKKLIFLSH